MGLDGRNGLSRILSKLNLWEPRNCAAAIDVITAIKNAGDAEEHHASLVHVENTVRKRAVEIGATTVVIVVLSRYSLEDHVGLTQRKSHLFKCDKFCPVPGMMDPTLSRESPGRAWNCCERRRMAASGDGRSG